MISARELLDVLRRLSLLEPAQLDEWIPQLDGGCCEPHSLLRGLTARGWLTSYQADQILRGEGEKLLLGPYLLLEQLGEGGMGAVFKARHRQRGSLVALKLIHKERLDHPHLVKRFLREARTAAQLDHPNVVRAFDADDRGETPYFAMEYVEGIDLARLVKQHGPLSVSQACDSIRQAAMGLQHAHERGLVHRDIKPHNLLLTPQGVVKVLDLGLARLELPDEESGSSSALTQEGAVMGTPDYIAPEQTLGAHGVDIRADLYSLGCTLYFLLTGRPPFPGGSLGEKIARHLSQEPQDVQRLRSDVPSRVAAVLRRLMAKKPEDRYATPAAVAAALAEAARPEQVPRAAETVTRPGPAAAASLAQLDLPTSPLLTVPPPRAAFQGSRVGLAALLVLVLLAPLTFFLLPPAASLLSERETSFSVKGAPHTRQKLLLPERVAEPIDLLARLDPARDTLRGQSRKIENRLEIAPGALVQIPVAVPEEYELTAAVLSAGSGGLSFFLPVGDGLAKLVVDGWGGRTGIDHLDGLRPDVQPRSPALHVGRLLRPARARELHLRVGKDQLDVHCDQQPIITWKGNHRQVDVSRREMFGQNRRLHLSLYHGSATFQRLEMVGGDSTEPLDLLTRIDPDRHAPFGTLRREEAGLTVAGKNGPTRLVLPWKPPEEYRLVMALEKWGGSSNLEVVLTGGGRRFVANIDRYVDNRSKGVPASGLGMLDGKHAHQNETTYFGEIVPAFRKLRLAFTVLREGIEVAAEGKVFLSYRGAWHRFNLPVTKAHLPADAALVLDFPYSTYCRIHELILEPLGPDAGRHFVPVLGPP